MMKNKDDTEKGDGGEERDGADEVGILTGDLKMTTTLTNGDSNYNKKTCDGSQLIPDLYQQMKLMKVMLSRISSKWTIR